MDCFIYNGETSGVEIVVVGGKITEITYNTCGYILPRESETITLKREDSKNFYDALMTAFDILMRNNILVYKSLLVKTQRNDIDCYKIGKQLLDGEREKYTM